MPLCLAVRRASDARVRGCCVRVPDDSNDGMDSYFWKCAGGPINFTYKYSCKLCLTRSIDSTAFQLVRQIKCDFRSAPPGVYGRGH